MKSLPGTNIISAIVILAKWDVGNPMVAEAFLASHLHRLPKTAAAPLAKVNTIQKIFGEHAKTVVAAATSERSDIVADMKTPFEQEANNNISHRTRFSELLSWCNPTAAGRTIAQHEIPPSAAGGPLPWAIQAATASAVLLVASTTEDDIMSAIRGLDDTLSASYGSSRDQPAIVVDAPSNSDREGQEPKAGAPKGDVQMGKEGGGEFQGRSALDLTRDTDLTKSLVGGPRQAGPLTHGF